MPITAGLVKIADTGAADGRLHRRIDIARGKSIAGRAGAIDADLDRGLAEGIQYGQIGDARYCGQHRLDLIAIALQRRQVVAVELDRILALDPGGRLLDVVLDVLREIEIHTR